jgi:Secretion system C-terminal sorting domain
LLIAFSSVFSLSGQNIWVFPGVNTEIDPYTDLNSSDISTHLLWDKRGGMSRIRDFNGLNAPPTNLRIWEQLYADIFRMTTSNYSPPLQVISQMRNDAYGTVSNATIKLGLLSINYDTIKSNAFSDDLLTVGLDKKFHDWPLRTASPYGTTRLFALTAFNEVALQPNVKFVLPTQFYYQNLNESPLSIQLDCGDGQGFRTFSWNQPINTNFITGGEKLITIRVTYPSGVYTSSTKLKVAGLGQSASGALNGPPPSDYIAPDEVWDIQGDSWTSPCDGSTSANSGRAYIRFGNGNRKLTKPIIFIDGIDFGRQITVDETRGNQVIGFGTIGWYNLASTEAINQTNPELARFRELSDQFKNNGYDIIFLDFRDGADYIQRCASVLKNLIIRVNNRKGQDATNGIVFPNMIIGPSMGGQVARFGLRYMEMAGINHCTSTYVSFDSPQQGANIPMGVQEFIRYQGLTLRVEFAEQKWENALNRPAAKQLLYQHRADDALCIRQQFVQERTALGYPSTRNIAITDGSLDAMPQAYAAGTNILDFDLRSDLIFWSSAKIVAANGDNSLVFQGKFPKKTISGAVLFGACAISFIAAVLLSWITAGGALIGASTVCSLAFALGATGLLPISFYEHTYFMPTNSVSADHVPGCTRGDIKDIEEAIVDGIPGFMQRSFLTLNKASDNFCFMPTVSTLDIQNPPNGFFSNVRQLVGTFRNPNKQFTPFDAIFELDNSQNLPHVQITAGMVTWILEQCVIGFERGTNLTTVYNYGYQRDKLGSMNILNGGHLKINAPGATGFVNISPEPNATNSSFTVSTTSESCGTVGVNIENGGQLSIGESSHSGILRLIGGTTLTVKNGGTLRLNNNAQLIVESGGRLIIEAGANINLVSNNSKIIVKNGGELIFNGQPTVTGNGHFLFEQGNIFTLNSNILLRGAGRTTPLIRIMGQATIVVNNPFEWRIEDAAVIHETGFNDTTHIFLRNGSTFRAFNTLFDDRQVILFGPRTATFIKVEEPIDLNNNPDDVDYSFENCIFQNTGIAVELDVPYAQNDSVFDWRNVNVEFKNTTFSNCQAIKADRSYITLFEDCTLTNANIDVAHTYWLNIRNTSIRSNLFSPTDRNYASYGSGIKASHVGHFWFRENSLIDGWGTGIDASSGLNWNIIMTDQSTIQRCATAIHLNGTKYNQDVDLGLLHMDCARLIENAAAIKGQDIIFSAYTRNGTANVFTRNINNPSGLFIESIFQNRFDTELWLHGNYWNGTTPATTPVNSSWSFLTRYNFPQPAQDWVGTIHINPDLRTSEFDPAVQGCGGIMLRGGQDDPLSKKTIVKMNGVLYDVKKQYDAALRILKKDKFKNALNTFRPIAQIPRNIRDTASATVKHFVDMARALTLNMGVQTRSVSSNGWLSEAIVGIAKPENALVLSPNPANEQFEITLPQGNYDIQVFDALGKLVFNKNTEGVATVDVRTWQNGIYIVNLLDKVSKKKTFSKVVVQH